MQIWRQGSECRIRALGGNLETPVVSGQELFQYGLRLLNGGCSGQAKLRYQAVLKSSRRAHHSTLRLWRLGEYHLDPQLVHGPAELNRRPSRPSAGLLAS